MNFPELIPDVDTLWKFMGREENRDRQLSKTYVTMEAWSRYCAAV